MLFAARSGSSDSLRNSSRHRPHSSRVEASEVMSVPRRWCTLRSSAALVIAVLSTCKDMAAAPADELFFQEKVLPLLQQHCYGCHSHAAGKMKGGLALDSRSGWEQGGDSGPTLKPGQ